MLTLHHTLSVWSVLALIAFGVNLLFHVIAFCSNSWCTFNLNGSHVTMGLWQGCTRAREDATEICNTDVLYDKRIDTGKNTGWLQGTQILMTCSLILLVITEFIQIGYTCIEKLLPFKDRLLGILFGMTIAQIPINGIILLMFGSEVSNLDNGKLQWSYGMVALCLCLSIAILILLYLDTFFYKRKQRLENGVKTKVYDYRVSTVAKDNPAFVDVDSTEYSGSAYTSEMQLSSNDCGTFDKYSSAYESEVTGFTTVDSDAKGTSQGIIMDAPIQDILSGSQHMYRDILTPNTYSHPRRSSLDSYTGFKPASKSSLLSLSRTSGSVSCLPDGGTFLGRQSKALSSNQMSSSSVESTV